MVHSFKNPKRELLQLVHKFEFISINAPTLTILDKHVPQGYAFLIFNTQGKMAVKAPLDFILPNHFLGIPNNRAVNFQLSEGIQCIIAICFASKLSKLLKLDFSVVENKIIDLNTLTAFTELESELKDNHDQNQIIKLIEDHLYKLYYRNYKEDEIDVLYNQIINSDGSQHLPELTLSFDKSTRFFRHHFRQRTGLKAKTLLRLARINHLWHYFNIKKTISFHDMVYTGGYHDQSHMIKDFKEIIGETPTKFFTRDLKNVKVLSNKS